MEKIVYYFSGTGNSLRTARIIAREIGGAKLVSVRSNPEEFPAAEADVIGFVCPAYEWNVPTPIEKFVEQLSINPDAYIFMISTYIAVHGKSFETIEKVLHAKGAHLSYGKSLRCVASQCTAYEPFPPQRFMVPHSEKGAEKIGKEIAQARKRAYPKMSPISRRLYSKMMTPFINVEHEYDKGFYPSDACIGCEVCRKVCPTNNISFENSHPVWNHKCVGCMACVVYCPKKAIQFKTPQAYVQLNNVISKKLALPESRTRYHNPYISAADLMKNQENVE